MWKALLFIVVSLAGTTALSFAGRLLLGAISKLLYLEKGEAIDRSHQAVWRYGTQTSTGVATKRQVYEHYHGQFTWYKRHDGVLNFLTLVTVAASTALPVMAGFIAFSPSRTTIWVVLVPASLGSLFIYFAWDEWFLFSRKDPDPFRLASKGDIKGLVGIVLSDKTIMVNWHGLRERYPDRIKKGLETLTHALQDRSLDSHVRRSVAETLGHIGDDAAVPVLREAVSTDVSTDVRAAAIGALAEVGTPAARAALEPIVDELVAKLESLRDFQTAGSVAWQLGLTRTRDPKATAVLEKLAQEAERAFSQHSGGASMAARKAIERLRAAALT
jgi:hypothetical protein